MCTFLSVLSCNAQSDSSNLDRLISNLEKSFKLKRIQPVKSSLSDNFTFNDFESLLSKQVLAGMVSGFPLKRIKNVQVLKEGNDTMKVKCDLVIDKFMGLMSQPITLVLVKDGEQLLLDKMIINKRSSRLQNCSQINIIKKKNDQLSEVHILTDLTN